MNSEAVRQFALSLPETVEAPHFHFASFRLGGRIFATMPPSNELLHVFLPEEERELAVRAHPDFCEVLHWGKRVVGLKVDLARAEQGVVEDLLRAAWLDKANKASK